jgi:uncharacterized membrane protein required for colicin V production
MLELSNISNKMGIVLDIILIALIGISIFLGYRKGLVKVAVKLCAFLIAVVVTLVLYKPVSSLIMEKTDLDEKIENVIIEKGTQEIQENKGDVKEDGFIAYMQEYVGATVANTQNEIVTNVAKVVSVKAINLIAIIGIFIITRLALILLTLISDIITKLPIIKQFNKLGGIMYGALRGLIVIYFILAIAFLIVSVTGNNTILTVIDSSIITKSMYTKNVLLKFIF